MFYAGWYPKQWMAPISNLGLDVSDMDHRLAMSALVFGLAASAPIAVDDAAFIDTSFPGFSALMDGVGATLTPA